MAIVQKIVSSNVLSRCLAASIIVALLGSVPLSAKLPDPEGLAFDVFRDGDPLGRHTVAFWRDGEKLHVRIDILLEVNLAFITLFRYTHQNHEIWLDDKLIAIDTQTDDDGDKYWLRGRATEAGFEVEGSGGRFIAPANVLPTSYWRPETATRDRLLDTQHGRLVDVATVPIGKEVVEISGRQVEAMRYNVSGDLDLDLWYTQAGEWAKITFEARGAEVVYSRLNGGASGNAIEDW